MLFAAIAGTVLLISLIYIFEWIANTDAKQVVNTFRRMFSALAIIASIFFFSFGMPKKGLPLIIMGAFLLPNLLGKCCKNKKNFETETMSIKEAADVLGISPNASKKEINDAYKKLMAKIHPDQGGSEYLAKKINQARDVMLNKL